MERAPRGPGRAVSGPVAGRCSADGDRGVRFWMIGYEMGEPCAGESAQLLGGDGGLRVALVGHPHPDARQQLVEVFGGPQPLQADHEDVPEPALVRGVRGPQRGVRRLRGRGAQTGRALVGEGLGEIGGGEVVAGLVGGGEQRVQVRIGAVGGQPQRPATAGAAGEQRGFGGRRRGMVETPESVGDGLVRVRNAGIRKCLPRYGRTGRRAGSVMKWRRSLPGAGVGFAGQRGLLERATSWWNVRGNGGFIRTPPGRRRRRGGGRGSGGGSAATLSTRGGGCPTDARISPGRAG